MTSTGSPVDSPVAPPTPRTWSRRRWSRPRAGSHLPGRGAARCVAPPHPAQPGGRPGPTIRPRDPHGRGRTAVGRRRLHRRRRRGGRARPDPRRPRRGDEPPAVHLPIDPRPPRCRRHDAGGDRRPAGRVAPGGQAAPSPGADGVGQRAGPRRRGRPHRTRCAPALLGGPAPRLGLPRPSPRPRHGPDRRVPPRGLSDLPAALCRTRRRAGRAGRPRDPNSVIPDPLVERLNDG